VVIEVLTISVRANTEPDPTPVSAKLLIDLQPGSVSLSEGQTTTAPAGHTVVFFIYVNNSAILGDGLTRVVGSDTTVYKVPYTWTNPTQWNASVEYYRVLEGGGQESTPAHTISLAPGETATGSFIDDDGPSTFTIWAVYDGIEEFASLGWVVSEGNETRVPLDDVDSVEVPSSSDEPDPVPEESLPTNDTDAGAPPSGSTGQSTGVGVPFVTSPSENSGDALTVGTFERAMAQIANAIGSSSGGGGSTTVNVDNSGVEERIDQTNTHLESIDSTMVNVSSHLAQISANSDAAEQRALEQEQELPDKPTQAQMEQQGSAAASQLEGLVPDASGVTPKQEVTGTAIDFSVSLPATMGGATFDLDPFRSDRLGPAISWFRSAVAWLAIVTFGAWVFGEAQRLFVDMSAAPQAKGNAVVGGTGGQATAQIAAGLITAALATGVVALVGWLWGDIGFAYLLNVAATNPLAGMPTKAAWLLNQFFPVATLLTVLVGRISYRAFSMKLYLITSSIVRHLTL
jgi:hypothetical protein